MKQVKHKSILETMKTKHHLLWIFLMLKIVDIRAKSAVVGSTVQLICPFDGRGGNLINWNIGSHQLAFGTSITANQFPDLKPRLSITGNHAVGEYHLSITDVRKADEKEYRCSGIKNSTRVTKVQLTVIVGPTDINISNKVSGKVQGTEDQDLTISCKAVGGDPPPDLTLQIRTDVYKLNSQHTIQRIIPNIKRSYDGVTVTCQTGYEGIAYTPLTDTANILLNLKPLSPLFSMNPVVTQNTKYLSLNCTSTGSRPAPTDRIWLIGDKEVNITSSSTAVTTSQQSDVTYTATSTLTYKVHKDYNQKPIKCGFRNTASGNNYIQSSTTVNVHYAPDVSVQNKTFTLTQSLREIQCVANGNPASSFSKWQHKSRYGELIRELDNSSTVVLRQQPEQDRYQETGEYVCTASNGIRDEEGNLNQKGSGYVISQAPPHFLNGSSQEKLGQYGKDVDIEVSVYSVPKYRTLTWIKGTSPLRQSDKYNMSDVPDVITDTFYGTRVQVDGFRFTLKIRNLAERDFDNYTLRLSNRVGNTVEHLIVLLSASPPVTPINFTVIDSTDSTITLQWIPAFDGGHAQNFVVEYRRAGSEPWKSATVSKTLITSQDELQTYELPGLKDSTSYEIRMYAENIFNKSQPTQIEMMSTKEGAQSSGQGAVIGAAVGSLGVIVVIVAVVAAVVVKKRRDGKGTKEILRSDPELDEGDGLKDNILYKSVDTGSKTPVSSEYAEVQKSNDVYAEVNKPKSQKNTKGKKSPGNKKQKPKAVNNNSADVYANQSDYANTDTPTGRYKNADGLEYAGLTFINPPKTRTGKSVIHGLDERTIYCDVDHTKKAPPPPREGAYELTEINQGKPT